MGVAVMTSTSGVMPFAIQKSALFDAKLVLFIYHHQAKVLEYDPLLDERVGSNDQLGAAVRHRGPGGNLFPLVQAAAQHADGYAHRLQIEAQRPGMLRSQDFRGRHHRGLNPALQCIKDGTGRHHGFSGAHIALQQPVHGPGLRHIGADFPDRLLLPLGQLERQLRPELPAPRPGCHQGASREETLGLHFTRHQHQLHAQEFLEDQSGAGLLDLIQMKGEMHGAQGLRQTHPVVTRAGLRGHHIHRLLGIPLEGLPQDATHGALRQLLGQRIHRNDAAHVQGFIALIARPLKVGVLHHQQVSPSRRLAVHHDPVTRGQLAD